MTATLAAPRPAWQTIRATGPDLRRRVRTAHAVRDALCPDCGDPVRGGALIVLRGEALAPSDDRTRARQVDLSDVEWTCSTCTAPEVAP